MNEYTGNHDQIHEGIQNFGDDAFATFTAEQFDITGLQSEYASLNPTNNPVIQRAVELELEERGLLTSLTINDDGSLESPLSETGSLSQAEMNRVRMLNMVEQTTGENADFLKEVADLTTAGGESSSDSGQVAREDLREAMRLARQNPDRFTEAQILAIQDLHEQLDSMPNNDWWFDGNDVGPENIVEYARKYYNVDTSIDEEQRAVLASLNDVQEETSDSSFEQTESTSYVDAAIQARMSETIGQEVLEGESQEAGETEETESEEFGRQGVEQEEPETDESANYTVESGDGFDRIARKTYEELFGERPSIQQEIALSKEIARLNNNDRDYSGGYIHPGDILTVPTKEEIQLLLN